MNGKRKCAIYKQENVLCIKVNKTYIAIFLQKVMDKINCAIYKRESVLCIKVNKKYIARENPSTRVINRS